VRIRRQRKRRADSRQKIKTILIIDFDLKISENPAWSFARMARRSEGAGVHVRPKPARKESFRLLLFFLFPRVSVCHWSRFSMDMETEELPLDLRLAAIITLLSSSALGGVTAGKSAALQHHLDTAVAQAQGQGRHVHLTSALRSASQNWQALNGHPDSMAWESFPRPRASLLH
jgi:hypothetical protein